MSIIDDAKKLALIEIEKYKSPPKLLFDTSFEKASLLAKKFNANEEIVLLGSCLSDLKLGLCLKEERIKDHIIESAKAAEEFLIKNKYPSSKIKKVLECIHEHHGAKKFSSIESEICCNSDCYRFLLPKTIVKYIAILGEREMPINELISQVEYKVNEKWNALSLDYCKKELKPNYELIKKFLEEAKK